MRMQVGGQVGTQVAKQMSEWVRRQVGKQRWVCRQVSPGGLSTLLFVRSKMMLKSIMRFEPMTNAESCGRELRVLLAITSRYS